MVTTSRSLGVKDRKRRCIPPISASHARLTRSRSSPEVDCIQYILISERFRKEVNSPGLHGSDGHGNVPVCGDEDNGNLNLGVSQLALQIESVDVSQPDIKDQTTRRVRPSPSQKVVCGVKGLHLKTYGRD